MLKKLDRQNQIISLIQQGHTINASELAQHLNVSVRTISRDIVDLENQGVQIYAHKGKNKILESYGWMCLEETY